MSRVFIYYNPKWGYIIASDTTLKDSGLHVKINPVDTQKADITEKQLGKAVLAGLEKSRRALPVERKEAFKFWQITGIKGFAAFSKKFECMEVAEKENVLKLFKLYRASDGSYRWVKNDKGIELPLSSPEDCIGQSVYQMLHPDETDNETEACTACFHSLNGNKVTYNRPSDSFMDAGDGHTDAYQVYTDEDNTNSYIAFLIDNGYEEISSQKILERWQQIYGGIKEYHFEETAGSSLKITVSAKTEKSDIKSYFYQDGEDLLEILTEVSTDIPKNRQSDIEREIKCVIDSISVS